MPKISKDKIDLFISLYNNGVSYDEISQKTSMHKAGFARLVSKFKLKPRLTLLSDKEKDFIKNNCEKGVSVVDIAKYLNRSLATIYNEIERQNIIYIDRDTDINKNAKKFKLNSNHLNPEDYISFIPTINNILMIRDNVASLGEQERQEVIPGLFSYFRERGFPFVKFDSDSFKNEFLNLKKFKTNQIVDNKDIYSDFLLGIEMVKHFFPHFYDMVGPKNKHSLYEAFNNDELLKKAIYNRLIQDGGYSINASSLIRGFRAGQIAFVGSTFRPTVAKAIYEIFCKNNDVIYDYSSGFGHRLLGALSLDKKVHYIGVDPFAKSIDSSKKMYSFLKEDTLSTAEFHCIGSEDFCIAENSVDFAFSSPPYFNLEIYDNAENQAYSKGYDYFINHYWKRTCFNLFKMLKPNKKLALNIKESVDKYSLANDMINCLTEAGFKLIDKYNLILRKNLAISKEKKTSKSEPIFIFEKQLQ